MLQELSNVLFHNFKSYILFLYLPTNSLVKTKAKTFYLKKGYYAYVGSMKIGIKRVERHFRKNKKKHWHIDFLTEISKVLSAILTNLEEIELSRLIGNIGTPIKGFGNTDIRTESNLFYFNTNPFEKVIEILERNRIVYEIFKKH